MKGLSKQQGGQSRGNGFRYIEISAVHMQAKSSAPVEELRRGYESFLFRKNLVALDGRRWCDGS
jgi:hypothetical protein